MLTINARNHLAQEVERRRTFAIISHPDAGKTTLTEKFLLYGGAVRLAGSVTARKKQRATTSDWLELERKRGISISSTVLQFDYQGFRINLLDTPGHQDFSEDTYRVLTAVDAVIMVIDAGKGIEAQTLKLFEVCRRRGVPIFTFMNKLDRPTREPLELLDELEEVLGVAPYPVNWPLGTGVDFRGVWDRHTQMAHLFERTPGGAFRAPVFTGGLDEALIRDRLDERSYRQVCEEVEILEAAGTVYDAADVAAGRTTPVYFGSAVNNFGIELLLDGFLEHAAPPAPRRSRAGAWVDPRHPAFSAFVFKIQANMDPLHRDRVAFLRVVSGKFERDMVVTHTRTGRTVRLANASKVFGSERVKMDEAYPGDVVGIVGNGNFAIGDTLTADPDVEYDEIPCFPPQCFAYLQNSEPAESKRFHRGLAQLLEEGVAQAYELPEATSRVPLLGAAGPLQFEVVQYRLESEYGAKSRWEPAPWTEARWLRPDLRPDQLMPQVGVQLALDSLGRRVLLFKDDWMRRYYEERNPDVGLSKYPPGLTSSEGVGPKATGGSA
jgi:peptide chain release factor 3